MFTQKHYQKIAETLSNCVEKYHGEIMYSTWRMIIRELEDMFTKDNPKFDVQKFEKVLYK